MALWEVIVGGNRADDEGEFDQSETADLALHVRQCTRRYRDLDGKLNLAIRLILCLCLMYLLNNVAAIKALLW